MRLAPKTGIKSSRQSKRIVALMLLVCVILTSLFSGAFLLTHANHEHDRNGVHGACTTCVQIQAIASLLKQFGAAVAGASFALVILFAVITGLRRTSSFFGDQTLVGLKVKMNH